MTLTRQLQWIKFYANNQSTSSTSDDERGQRDFPSSRSLRLFQLGVKLSGPLTDTVGSICAGEEVGGRVVRSPARSADAVVGEYTAREIEPSDQEASAELAIKEIERLHEENVAPGRIWKDVEG